MHLGRINNKITSFKSQKKLKKCHGSTNQPTDQPMDQPMDHPTSNQPIKPTDNLTNQHNQRNQHNQLTNQRMDKWKLSHVARE